MIFIQSLFLGNLSQITVNFIWPYTLTYVFYWLPYRMASYLRTIWLFRVYTIICDASPVSNPVQEKKETYIYYVANIITLRVVLELLWEFTLLICYKLNIFRPPRVNQFDICALLFRGYARFILLDKMVFYSYWKALSSISFLMLHIAWHCFVSVMDYVVIFFIILS